MFLEDFIVGQKYILDPVAISREEIFSFAAEYDPQPLHVDEAFAAESIFHGIIASGYHTLCVIWKQFIKLNLFSTEIVGGVGFDYLRWTAPVYPGDRLFTDVEIIEVIPIQGKKQGILVTRFETRNESGKLVFTMLVRQILKCRS